MSTLEEVVRQIPSYAPMWLAYLVGVVLSLVYLKRLGWPAAFALAGCGLFLLFSIGGLVVQSSLFASQRYGAMTHGELANWLSVVGIVRTVLYVTAFSLLLAAVFSGRKAPRRPAAGPRAGPEATTADYSPAPPRPKVDPDGTRSAPEPPDGPVPDRIGRYRILDRLGAGGMGEVYMARDPQLNRLVAVKVPHFDGPASGRALRVQRFQREARAAASVRHAHVCPIYDVGDHRGRPYVVMAYIEGDSLAARLACGGRYDDVRRAVALVREVLDALTAIHGHGIVHRDLKPSNILLDTAGRSVLTDFGLARPADEIEGLTSEGVVMGTPAYMAPEQAAGQTRAVGPWTDLYSLGVILYEVLTGRRPFEGPAMRVMAQILNESAPLPSGLRPDLDPALEAVIRKAMSREPELRYQNAHQFVEALAAFDQRD